MLLSLILVSIYLGAHVVQLALSISNNYYNALNGQHLRVLAMEFPLTVMSKRNATGHVIHIQGVLIQKMETLSKMLNFSFSYLPVVVRIFDDSPYAKGAVFYLANNEADYVLSTSIGTSTRLEKVAYPTPWIIGSFGVMIPYPKETINIAASFAPLSVQVWVWIVVTVFSVALCLRVLNAKVFEHLAGIKEQRKITNEPILQYVIRNLFSQGQSCFSRRLTIRIAAGAWTLGCFFFVQIYCSTLTSHLTSPNQKPIINSFSELANTRGIGLTTDRGYGFDTILQSDSMSGQAKRLVNLLRNDPNSLRCNATADCLERVRAGHAVYIAPINTLNGIADNDFKNSSTCNYGVLKEDVWSSPVFTTLPKNSRYTEDISRGILRLQAAGLIKLWENQYTPKRLECMDFNKRKKKMRLSLGNLSSAFVILLAGYALSIFILLIEKMSAFLHRSDTITIRKKSAEAVAIDEAKLRGKSSKSRTFAREPMHEDIEI